MGLFLGSCLRASSAVSPPFQGLPVVTPIRSDAGGFKEIAGQRPRVSGAPQSAPTRDVHERPCPQEVGKGLMPALLGVIASPKSGRPVLAHPSRSLPSHGFAPERARKPAGPTRCRPQHTPPPRPQGIKIGNPKP